MIRAGSISHSQNPDVSERTARALSYMDLLTEIAGTNPSTARHILFAAELRRREGRTGRLALGISFLSLVVSFSALVSKGLSVLVRPAYAR